MPRKDGAVTVRDVANVQRERSEVHPLVTK